MKTAILIVGVFFSVSLFCVSCGTKTENGLNSLQPLSYKSTPKFMTLPVKEADVANGWYYSDYTPHYSVDFRGEEGDEIYAECTGKAIYAYSSSDRGAGFYANYVLIHCDQLDENGNNFMIINAHLSAPADFIMYKEGDKKFDTDYDNWTPVTQGEVIGYMGKEGTSWVHLHMEVFVGSYANKASNRIDPYDIYSVSNKYGDNVVCGEKYLWKECPPTLPKDNVYWHPEGTLIKTASDPKVYQRVLKNLVQWIPSEDAFNDFNLDWNKIITVTDEELACYAYDGSPTMFIAYEVFYTDITPNVKAWLKYEDPLSCDIYAISNDAILETWGFTDSDIITGQEADDYYSFCTQRDAKFFREGSLVQCSDGYPGYDPSAVFAVERDGELRPILNGDVFEKLGYDWNWIVKTDSVSFSEGISSIGDTIEYDDIQYCSEQDVAVFSVPICNDGSANSCYDGPGGTENVGECRSGASNCENGNWGICLYQVLPTTETYDGLDNDCDGQTDEDFLTGGENCQIDTDCSSGYYCNESDGSCIAIEQSNGTECLESQEGGMYNCYSGLDDAHGIGICRMGYHICNNGFWSACYDEVTPQEEILDGLDNDCDGSVDEGLSFSPPPLPSQNNLLGNPGFEENYGYWELEDWYSFAEFSLDCGTAYDGRCSGMVENKQRTDYCAIQLKQQIALERGKRYTVEFAAKADSLNRSMEVQVVQNYMPWSVSLMMETVWLNSEWDYFSFTFESDRNDSNFKLAFHLGDSTDTVWIDQVSLSEQ